MAVEKVIAEGKTKRIIAAREPGCVILQNKNDITKNDNPSQTQTMQNKGVYATATTCEVFELLAQAGIPVAYKKKVSDTSFLAPVCDMIFLEVIARRYGDGSYLKRNPHLKQPAGMPPHRFHRLEFELFLKTTGGKVMDKMGRVLCETPMEPDAETGQLKHIDDPFIRNPYDRVWELFHPKKPKWEGGSYLNISVPAECILPNCVKVEEIEKLTRQVFLVLERAWAILGYRLVDFKIEFGIGPNGELFVADVIDNDSWRLRTIDWKELSKQLFRDNADMALIADKYALVAELVKRFRIPRQAIVLWRGSESDELPEVCVNVGGVEEVAVVVSGHKKTGQTLKKLEGLLARFPGGGVIIAPVGMSNGLGPMLAARTSWPVIAVPTTAKARPHDVWSSLECPSEVPLATVLSSKNAVFAALNVLAQSNPAAYMVRQYAIELLDE